MFDNMNYKLIITKIVLVLCLPVSLNAQAGALDQSFGTNGIVVETPSLFNDDVRAITVQDDGKFLIGGYIQNSFTSWDFGLIRFNDDGTKDLTFGNNGTVITPIENQSEGNALAIQNDGKIVMCGASDWHINLARYSASGAIDNSLGQNGTIITDISGYYSELCTAIDIQNDGKILLAGYAQHNSNDNSYIVLLRYNVDGTLDNSFGTNGIVVGTEGESYDMTVQDDGKIILCGTSNSNLALWRYNADGSVDNSFGSNGLVLTPFGNSAIGKAMSIVDNNKILVGGHAHTGFLTNAFLLSQYNSDGTPDNTFGTNGIANAIVGTSSQTKAMAITDNGSIFLAGAANNGATSSNLALAKFESDGSLDLNFGDNGTVITQISSTTSQANDMAIHDNGRLLLAGHFYNTDNQDLVIARYFTGEGLRTDDLENDETVLVYPNPSNAVIHIEFNEFLTNVTLVIFDNNGKKVKEISNWEGYDTLLNFAGLDSGLYYLSIMQNGKKPIIKKVVIN